MANSSPDWERWIFASASQYFDDQKGDLTYWVEGQEHVEDADYIEFRMTGPDWHQVSRNSWVGKDIIINILVKTVKSETDLHKQHKTVGQVREMFGTCILIINQETQEVIGRLMRKSSIKVMDFGQIAPEVRSIQSTIEASYDAEMD